MNDCLNDMFDIVPSLPKKVENNLDRTQILEGKAKILEAKVDRNDKFINEQQKNIKKLESKIQDFNILELFKSNGNENGEETNIISLINNLDKKITSKLNFMDEKMKSMDEITYKSSRDVKNAVNSSDLNKRNFNQMKENQDLLENKLNNLEKMYNSKSNETDKELQD